jgi:hypothetical protein
MTTKNRYTEEDLPQPGSVFFIPLKDGRFGIASVVKRVTAIDPNESTATRTIITARVLVVPSSWVGPNIQRPSDDDIRKQLVLNHHSWKNEPQAIWITEPPPADFIFAGSLQLTPEDEAKDSVTYGGWNTLCLQPLLQWRWDNDRENLLLEESAEREKVALRSRQFAEKQAEILRTTTLDDLAQRTWFTTWDAEHEILFREESVRLIKILVQELRVLPKLTKAAVRRHLRICVEAFNQLDAKDSFIDTTHREDIIEALELIVLVTRYPNLFDAIDDWRDW